MKIYSVINILLINFLITGFVYAGKYDNTSKEWQIKAYSSAAPDFIGNFATIVGADGKVIREGSNGWTCMAGNGRPYPKKGWKNTHDAMPTCNDKEAMKWMSAFMKNEEPKLDKDGWMWMLHGDVGEDNLVAGVLNKEDSTPGQWIESGPHLMFIPKDIKSLDNWNTDFTTGEPYVMFPGTVYAHVMIPVEGYYKYQKESEPK
jgi:hypothetical protein